jgi:hypothetical protein
MTGRLVGGLNPDDEFVITRVPTRIVSTVSRRTLPPLGSASPPRRSRLPGPRPRAWGHALPRRIFTIALRPDAPQEGGSLLASSGHHHHAQMHERSQPPGSVKNGSTLRGAISLHPRRA